MAITLKTRTTPQNVRTRTAPQKDHKNKMVLAQMYPIIVQRPLSKPNQFRSEETNK